MSVQWSSELRFQQWHVSTATAADGGAKTAQLSQGPESCGPHLTHICGPYLIHRPYVWHPWARLCSGTFLLLTRLLISQKHKFISDWKRFLTTWRLHSHIQFLVPALFIAAGNTSTRDELRGKQRGRRGGKKSTQENSSQVYDALS